MFVRKGKNKIHLCDKCKCDISHRFKHAKYCKDCYNDKKRKCAREYGRQLLKIKQQTSNRVLNYYLKE